MHGNWRPWALPTTHRTKMAAFPEHVCFRLRLLRALETAGQKVLTCILLCGTPGKTTSESLLDYLNRLPDTSTAKYRKLSNKDKKKYFDDTQIIQINNYNDIKKFDVTLLFKAIIISCERWDDKSYIHSLVRKIKNIRNSVVHETHVVMTESEFQDKLRELEDDCVATLNATETMYNSPEAQRECDQTKAEVTQLFHSIRVAELTEILKDSWRLLVPCFQTKAAQELQQSLPVTTFLRPLRFLDSHEDHQVNVRDIFSEIIIKDKNGGDIHYSKLLTLAQNGGAPPPRHLLLVEGDAGSGKSTLLTFTLSEYLQSESCRRMEGLGQYHLLCWVTCRERNPPTFEKLIERMLSDAHGSYGKQLIPFLRHCSILVILDGTDEVEDNSLIKDILAEGKDWRNNFAVLSSSRPEAIGAMKAMSPDNFKVSHLKVEGVSVDKRQEVALRHYHALCGTGPKDEEGLKKVLQEVALTDIFRLPLNLLFLVTLFHDRPQEMKTRITQTDLYHKILENCAKRLQHRLAGRDGVPPENRLERAIQGFLSELKKIATEGLLRKELCLSSDDEERLDAFCVRKNLPLEDTISSFYSLRKINEKRQYHPPHQSFQDYFAASHIYSYIESYRQGDILRQLQSIAGSPPELPPLRNMLLHLMTMISSTENPKSEALKEAIALLYDSGVKDTDDWLSVLSDVKLKGDSMQMVADLIDRQTGDGERITVRDGTVHVAAELLPLIRRVKEIWTVLTRDCENIRTMLEASNHKFTHLHLHHHFRRPRPGSSSAPLLLQARGYSRGLKEFKGQLEGNDVQLLPEGLRSLYLSVAEGERVELEHIHSTCPHLTTLGIHVPVPKEVTTVSFQPLPDVQCVLLFLSGVGEEDVHTAVGLAAALSPRKEGYGGIRFPGASLDAHGWEELLQGLRDNNVRVWGGASGVEVPNTTPITALGENMMDDLAWSLLGCRFTRMAEGWLWR